VLKARIMKWVEKVARMDKMRGAKFILVRKPECRGPFGRFRNRWKDNFKVDGKEICYKL
jgi:hypothetical protein